MENISVRNLVEFILRNGDIESSSGGVRDTEAMQQGARIHKIIQGRKGVDYKAEVQMSVVMDAEYDGCKVNICVEGRADGVIERQDEVIINEIKSMYQDVTRFEKPESLHRAQVMCYAAMYILLHEGENLVYNDINILITYCQMETMFIKEFEEHFKRDEIITWFEELINQYAKWVVWKLRWKEKSENSVKSMEFPFEYREGQFELVKGVYLSILRNKNLFIQAPTGVGKTITTVYPSVTAMGEQISEKIFYLTAKTITRTVAEDTFKILVENGVALKCVTITAKDKICIFNKADCNPVKCVRAKGHYDRVNDAVYDMLVNEEQISRELIEKYAEKHTVCPFEMGLDLTTWSDVVICDYNYVFDPNVKLKRFFADGIKHNYVFLIDEAHNLVDRAREMYSAVLSKELVMDVKRSVKLIDEKLYRGLESVNKILLALKRDCNDFEVISSIDSLIFPLMRVVTLYDNFLKDILPKHRNFGNNENLMQLYFDIRYFLATAEMLDEKYRIYNDFDDGDKFRVTLQCMDPSKNLIECLSKGRSAVFFSATLLPVRYYMGQLGGTIEDYAVYAESVFKPEQQLIMAATDVSTKYTRRTTSEYEKIVNYIISFTQCKKGNYIAFFPSYKMMIDIFQMMPEADVLNSREECDAASGDIKYIIQHNHMSEIEKEEFLKCFENDNDDTRIGFCVLGGIFGEGIDLRNDRLIGVVVVGTGLPMVGNERELYRNYYDEMNGKGFEYAYLYPGMNKVLQAAGRVIRTAEDKGTILLLDERFATNQYTSLFPREWRNVRYVNVRSMQMELLKFWGDR